MIFFRYATHACIHFECQCTCIWFISGIIYRAPQGCQSLAIAWVSQVENGHHVLHGPFFGANVWHKLPRIVCRYRWQQRPFVTRNMSRDATICDVQGLPVFPVFINFSLVSRINDIYILFPMLIQLFCEGFEVDPTGELCFSTECLYIVFVQTGAYLSWHVT